MEVKELTQEQPDTPCAECGCTVAYGVRILCAGEKQERLLWVCPTCGKETEVLELAGDTISNSTAEDAVSRLLADNGHK